MLNGKQADRSALRGAVRVIFGMAFVLATAASPWWLTSGVFLPMTERAALFSASLFSSSEEEAVISMSDAHETELTTNTTAVTTTSTATTGSVTEATTTTSETAVTDEESGERRPVRETKIGNSGTLAGGIYVRNGAGYDLDIEAALETDAECRIKRNAGYQVLIIHTHTTECYAQDDSGSYDVNYSPRTTDKSMNMVAVGDVVAERLEDAGIKTLHVTTIHDYPQYNGSYNRAEETITEYLEKYPSIEMVIDIHRDCITQDDGTRIKPTAVIDGRKAAQIMIITGCDNNGKLIFPEWEKNLRMAAQLQRQAVSDWGELMRPLYFAPFRYNMHLTPNSLLVEFGTDVNTLEEALYSADMFGRSLAAQLLRYDVDGE